MQLLPFQYLLAKNKKLLLNSLLLNNNNLLNSHLLLQLLNKLLTLRKTLLKLLVKLLNKLKALQTLLKARLMLLLKLLHKLLLLNKLLQLHNLNSSFGLKQIQKAGYLTGLFYCVFFRRGNLLQCQLMAVNKAFVDIDRNKLDESVFIPVELRRVAHKPITNQSFYNFRVALEEYSEANQYMIGQIFGEIIKISLEGLINRSPETTRSHVKSSVMQCAVRSALAREVRKVFATGAESIDRSAIIDIASQLSLTRKEEFIIWHSVKNPDADPEQHWSRESQNRIGVGIAAYALMVSFYYELAEQNGLTHQYLFEDFIFSFDLYATFIIGLELDCKANRGEINIVKMAESGLEKDPAQLRRAKLYVKSCQKYKESERPLELYRMESQRLNLLYMLSCLQGEDIQIKLVEAFKEIFASPRFVGLTVEQVSEKLEEGRPTGFQIHPTLFVDAVEQRFLGKLESTEKIDFVREMAGWVKQAAIARKQPVPEKYQGLPR